MNIINNTPTLLILLMVCFGVIFRKQVLENAFVSIVADYYTPRLLSTYSTRELDMAFMCAPEMREHYLEVGRISPYRKAQVTKLSLKRIKAELKRRKPE